MERTSLEEMVEYVCIVKVDMKGFVVSETSGEKVKESTLYITFSWK